MLNDNEGWLKPNLDSNGNSSSSRAPNKRYKLCETVFTYYRSIWLPCITPIRMHRARYIMAKT